jgi:tetratricopeptide (TPR) repeat protein
MAGAVRLPYPGLRAFARDESDLFFGREDCIDQMIDRLAATRFLAVLGPSGSGKSSLVRTGLFDALELGLNAKAGAHWQILDIHPGGQPTRNLAAALLGMPGGAPAAEMDADLLASFLARGPRSLLEWCRDGHLVQRQNLLVLIDQFEELFRYQAYAEREEAEAFIALLLESSRSLDVPINVIITMRSEYLGACALFPGLAERINEGLYLTPRMTREQCRAAIEGPAGVGEFTVDPELVNTLLNDMASFAPWEMGPQVDQLQAISRRADQLPLMQHVLNRLWLRALEAKSTWLTLVDYQRIGGLRGALDAHAAEVMKNLPASTVEAVFRALISGTSLQNAVRRPCRFRDLVHYTGTDRETAAEVVNAFRAFGCNFLQPPTSEPLRDDTVIDISHESLIRQWSRLADWFEHEARAAQSWGRLLSAQQHYARREGNLLGGLDLGNLGEWWSREKPNAAWAERYGGQYQAVKSFLEESHAAERRSAEARRRRQAITLATVMTLLIVFVSLSAYGFIVNRQAAAARADLEKSNRTLQSTNAQLQQTTVQLAAENQRANDAYNLALQASDQFLTGIADKLLATPGVSKSDVAQILDKADAYLTQLETSTEGTSLAATAARARGRADLQFADIDEANADYKAMRMRAQAVRTNLLEGRIEADLKGEDLFLLAQTYLIEGRSYVGDGTWDKAAAPLTQAKQLFDVARQGAPTDRTLINQAGAARYWISHADELEGKNQDAIAGADDCIAMLRQNAPDGVTALSHILVAKCLQIQGNANQAADRDKAATLFQASGDELGKIPNAQRNRDYYFIEGQVLHALGAINQAKEPLSALAAAIRFYANASDVLEEMLSKDPYDKQLRDFDATDLSDLAQAWSIGGQRTNEQKYFNNATNIFERAYKAREYLTGDAAGTPTYSQHLEALLQRELDNIEQINTYKSDADLSGTYTDRLRGIIAIEEKSAAATKDSDEKEALLRNRLYLAEELLERAKIVPDKGTSYLEESSKITGELFASCDQGYAANSLSVYGGRMCFKALVELTVPEQELGIFQTRNDIDRQISLLERSKQRFEAFLNRFHESWQVEDSLGGVAARLAKLYIVKGQKEKAGELAMRSADLYSKDGVQLLADWYASGAGPLPADPAKADRFRTLLQTRNWEVTSVQLQVRSLSDPGSGTPEYNLQRYVSFINPRFNGDDPIERSRVGLEKFEGYEIRPSQLNELRDLFHKVMAEKRSFTEALAFAESGMAFLATTIAAELESSLKSNDFAATAQFLQEQWSRLNGRDAVTSAVRQALKDAASDPEDIRRKLIAVGDELSRQDKDAASAAILTVLIETASGDPKDSALLFVKRADLRYHTAQADLRERDLEIALALSPDDPSIETALGLEWIEFGKYLTYAIHILEHARQSRPDDPLIMDSLGWANVKIGKFNDGIELLSKAAAALPQSPEILVHLASAHRLAGRTEDAASELEQALALKPNNRTYGLTNRKRARIPQPPGAKHTVGGCPCGGHRGGDEELRVQAEPDDQYR